MKIFWGQWYLLQQLAHELRVVKKKLKKICRNLPLLSWAKTIYPKSKGGGGWFGDLVWQRVMKVMKIYFAANQLII